MTMTEKLKSCIQVPQWVIALTIPLLISLIGALITLSAKAATVREQVTQHTLILEKKANQSDVDRIYVTLDRIENKIDKLTTEH
jgi:L-lactate permease